MKKVKKSIVTLLAGRMAENNLTFEDVAIVTGESSDTVRRRFADPDKLTLGEMRKLCTHLNISVEEAKVYLW